jgi:hypothetical protein
MEISQLLIAGQARQLFSCTPLFVFSNPILKDNTYLLRIFYKFYLYQNLTHEYVTDVTNVVVTPRRLVLHQLDGEPAHLQRHVEPIPSRVQGRARRVQGEGLLPIRVHAQQSPHPRPQRRQHAQQRMLPKHASSQAAPPAAARGRKQASDEQRKLVGKEQRFRAR